MINVYAGSEIPLNLRYLHLPYFLEARAVPAIEAPAKGAWAARPPVPSRITRTSRLRSIRA